MQLPSMIRSRFRFAGDLARAADVARVLAKYGLAAWLTEIEWEPIHNALRSHAGEVLTDLPFEARFRLALSDLGTTFIKLGQMLSTRPDLVGKPMADELSKLQAGGPVDPPAVAAGIVQTELGRPVAECFTEFDGTALASASIGQVHLARMRSGKRAVVKVQHPGIEGTIRRDLDILRFLADIAEKNERMRAFQPAELIRQFSRMLLNELDFRREMRNLQTFRRNFAADETVVFPKPYPELSTGRVLTMHRLQGCGLTDSAALDAMGVNREELARSGANVFIEMIFRDGFYHADPHPGNFMIMRGGRIGLLDAGMVGRIDENARRQIVDILLAAADRDAPRLTDSVLRVCGTPDGLDRNALSTDLTELFEDYGVQSVGAFNVSGALNGMTEILHRHGLVLPGNFSMLIKCLILLEGTSRLLNPGFNLAELLEPWRAKYVRMRLSPKTRLKELRRIWQDWQRTAESIPKAITNMVDRLETGKFSISLEHQHLKSAANRVVVGMFISSLLIGSSVLIAHDMPPTIRGVSIFGLAGYLFAALFGFRILWVNRDRLVSRRHGDWD
jgi:ubiquinone biosynthesis protein